MDQEYQRQCQRMGCTNPIDVKRKLARFCSAECRLRDHREMRKHAEICVCASCGATHAKKSTRRKKVSDEIED